MNSNNDQENFPHPEDEENQAFSEGAQEGSAGFQSRELHLEQPWRDEALRAVLPWPDESTNKYARGKLMIMAGSSRYPGAACLATRAAQRMGVGYAQVVTASSEVKQLVLNLCPSAVFS
ncbi:MAG: hypothetical protein J5804_05290 [Eggerthellaceae bacterium]|nr:hypothetical protein [Eggerthellaceae bacterium]